jgi:hypothetical protein
VLHLIAPHGHAVSVEQQNVRRHQDGVAVEPHRHAGIGVFASGHVHIHRGLVSMRPVHLALGGDAGEQPVELGGFGDVALAVEGDALGVEPGGEPGGGDFKTRAGDARRVVALDERVVVGQKQEALDPGLAAGRDGGPDGADVVAQVGRARGGDAGEDAFSHGALGNGFGMQKEKGLERHAGRAAREREL